MGRRKKKEKLEEIRDIRTRNYRQIPELTIRTESDALDFVTQVGMCLLFPSSTIELPNMLQGTYGMPHPMTNNTHWDKETIWTWNLKDELPERGLVFYGKFIQDKGTFLSSDFISYFCSVINLTNKLDNYKSLYHTGEISQLSKNIADLLLENGSLSTKELKIMLNLTNRKGGIAFHQAMTNLQSNLIVTNYGTDCRENKTIPSTRYELVARVFYDQLERAQQIMSDEARKLIINKYLDIIVEANVKEISKLFRWNIKIVDSILKELLKENLISCRIVKGELQYYNSKYDILAS